MSSTTLLLIIGGLVAVVIARAVLSKYAADFLGSVESWTTYFRGPGAFQLVFLLIGGIGAGASVYLGPSMRNLSVVGQAKEYHIQVDSSKPVLYQENIQNYSYVTLFARAMEPDKGAARLTVFRNGIGGNAGDTTRLENVTSSTWSRLDLPNTSSKDQPNTFSNMSLIVEPPTTTTADTVPATKVDVLVYLNLK